MKTKVAAKTKPRTSPAKSGVTTLQVDGPAQLLSCHATEPNQGKTNGGARLLPLSPGAFERDSYSSTAFAEILDRSVRAGVAQLTNGLSPSALGDAYTDWAVHLATSPGKQLQLMHKAAKKWMRLANFWGQCACGNPCPERCIEPLPQDRRFQGEDWQTYPYNLIYQSFLLTQQWWHNATTGVRGVTKEHENMAEFASRQLLDMIAPSNFIATNPEVLARTREEAGMNLLRGWQNFMEDWERALSGRKPVGTEQFRVGENIAVTPGKVVYRNRLIELIQYDAVTDEVRPEPILIVPAWIMKYYILDLSPENSLVKYLTQQGFTVFMISWKNPGPEDRDIGMDDYLELGVTDALEAVQAASGCKRVHGVGYCLGGTLLSIAAAAMARDGDERFCSVTFFAAEVDFSEAGELTLFINESQVTFLEDMMWEQGFLDPKQMSGAFQLLRSNDLIWSKVVHDYLRGERSPMIDLMAWNADATRMPFKMHSEYLRQLFLNNDLAEGRYRVGGQSVSLTDIRAPIFAVATEWDHVAPWRSVYKLHLLADTEVTFLLTNGGHNAGIISEPGHPNRHYRCATKQESDNYRDPDTWVVETTLTEGSWWPTWTAWLTERSGPFERTQEIRKRQQDFEPICDAPGLYVLGA